MQFPAGWVCIPGNSVGENHAVDVQQVFSAVYYKRRCNLRWLNFYLNKLVL